MPEPLKSYRVKLELLDDLGWPYETERLVYIVYDVERVFAERQELWLALEDLKRKALNS